MYSGMDPKPGSNMFTLDVVLIPLVLFVLSWAVNSDITSAKVLSAVIHALFVNSVALNVMFASF